MALNNIDISVITPLYKGAAYLATTIRSVQAQTCRNWEMILLDDGSPDDSIEIAQKFAAQDSRIRTARQANQGIAAARNRGFAETDKSTKYCIFLDQDDVWEPNALELLAAALDAHPTVSAAYGCARMIGSEGEVSPDSAAFEASIRNRKTFAEGQTVLLPESAPTTFATLLMRNILTTVGMVMMRREAFDTIGGFDQAMAPADDWDFWLRMTRISDLYFVPDTIMNYRVHEANTSQNRKTMAEAEKRIWRKVFASPDNSPAQQRIIEGAYKAWEMDASQQKMESARYYYRKRLFGNACLELARFGTRRLAVLRGKP